MWMGEQLTPLPAPQVARVRSPVPVKGVVKLALLCNPAPGEYVASAAIALYS
jgi:hypothetical protein